MVLICISLISNEMELLFKCLLAILFQFLLCEFGNALITRTVLRELWKHGLLGDNLFL